MGYVLDILVQLVHNYGLIGLFISVFLSYSILPSATIVPIIITLGFFNPWIVFFISLVAATFGSILNYYIGLKGIRSVARFLSSHPRLKWLRKYLPTYETVKKAEVRIDKYGPWALLFLTWLPVIGDPIIVAAGVLKMNFWKFLVYSTFSKMWYLQLIIFFGVVLI